MKSIISTIDKLIARVGIVFVRAYQYTLKHWLGQQCRFYPSCSYYSIEAFEVHGGIKGAWLTLKRLLRCNPLGPSGVDFVPDSKAKPSKSVSTYDSSKKSQSNLHNVIGNRCHCEKS